VAFADEWEMMNGGPFVPPPRPIAPRFEPLPPETWGAEGSAFPGVPPMPPPPMPEIAPYHPYRPPGFIDRVLGTAGQTQFYGQVPPGVMLPALLLKTIAGMRGHKLEREEMERQELNRRGELAATARNQANLEASRVERSRRFAMEDRALAARDRATERTAERTADTERRTLETENRRLSPSEAAMLGLPLDATLKPIRELPQEWRDKAVPGVRSQHRVDMWGQDFNPDRVAEAIAVDGTASPDQAGYSKGQWGMISTSLKDNHPGFNVMRAQADWRAANRYYSGLNTSLQLRLRQAIENAYETAEQSQRISDNMLKTIPRGNLTLANRGLMTLAREGALGPEATASAQQLVSFVNALQFELANVYMGGGVPTDQASKKAREIIHPDMSPVRLRAALQAARQELTIRRNAITQAGMVSPSNPPLGVPQEVVNIGGHKLGPVGGGDGAGVWMRDPEGIRRLIPPEMVEQARQRGAVEVP
jgi:hypothetical protein